MRRLFSSLFIILLLTIPLSAGALPLVWSGTGFGVGGEAISVETEFDFVTHDFGAGAVDAFQITLRNLSPTTSYRSNLLTGFFFSLDGVGALPTSDSGFDGLAATVRTSNTTSISNVDIAPAVNNSSTDGTYQLSNGPFGISNGGVDYSAYQYGIATVGYGLAGLNGAALEGDNYGIAAAGSDLTLDGLPSALPVIDASVVFWMAKPAELLSLSQVTNGRWAFGSLPDHQIDHIQPVPEPATGLLLGTALIGMMGWVGLRRRTKA